VERGLPGRSGTALAEERSLNLLQLYRYISAGLASLPPLLPSHAMKKTVQLLAAAALVLAQPAAGQTDFPALGREIETLVRERFYDAARV
jgi:hypothetical protein